MCYDIEEGYRRRIKEGIRMGVTIPILNCHTHNFYSLCGAHEKPTLPHTTALSAHGSGGYLMHLLYDRGMSSNPTIGPTARSFEMYPLTLTYTTFTFENL
jgi:hypothetical protein